MTSTNYSGSAESVALGREHSQLIDVLRTMSSEFSASIIETFIDGDPYQYLPSFAGIPAGTISSRNSRGKAEIAGMADLHGELQGSRREILQVAALIGAADIDI